MAKRKDKRTAREKRLMPSDWTKKEGHKRTNMWDTKNSKPGTVKIISPEEYEKSKNNQ